MRETWLSENQRLVSQDNFGYDLAAVEAATKKHEAIETDINAYEERVQAVVAVAQELENEKYHDIERINSRFVWPISSPEMEIDYHSSTESINVHGCIIVDRHSSELCFDRISRITFTLIILLCVLSFDAVNYICLFVF